MLEELERERGTKWTGSDGDFLFENLKVEQNGASGASRKPQSPNVSKDHQRNRYSIWAV
jgi:hypothetical protein